jgi:hypothetical protein
MTSDLYIPLFLIVCLAVLILIAIKKRKKELVKPATLGVALGLLLSESDLLIAQLQVNSIVLFVLLAVALFSAVYLVMR